MNDHEVASTLEATISEIHEVRAELGGRAVLLAHHYQRPELVALSDIRGARPVAPADLKGKLGFAIRIGVGGLWGAFGWVWTSRLGMVEIYISRHDHFLWIDRHEGKPLLITAEREDELARALEGS